jgi:uncharacterized protein (TIGR03435 family)
MDHERSVRRRGSFSGRKFRAQGVYGGQTGEPTFTVDYAPLEGEPAFPRFQNSGVTGPSIFEAIEKNLGLKLESTKAAVKVMVFERAEKLEEN